MLEMISVDSSAIKAIGHDESEQVLEVQFNKGRYRYYGISNDLYNQLLEAPSVGKFFHENIKDKFTTVRIG